MKTFFFLFLLLVVLVLPSHARLGETIEQCVQRYGDGKHNQGKSAKRVGGALLNFEKNNLRISVEFFDGIAVCIEYRKPVREGKSTKGIIWTDEEVMELAEANKEDSSWQKSVVEKYGIIRFKRADGKATGGSFLGVVSFSKKIAEQPPRANTSGL